MRKVVRLQMSSVLKIFALFYACVGFYAASKAAVVGEHLLVCPFGFAYPMAHAYITITLPLPNSANWLTAGLILITAIFYAITGVISGIVVVFAHNFAARFWPLLYAQVEADAKPLTPAPEAGASLIS